MKITNLKSQIPDVFRQFCLSLAFLSFFTVTIFAQEQPPKPSAPRSATIPQPQERTLKNGLRVIAVQTKNVPLVTASLMIKSGGEVDPANLAGAADMTAALLTKGTKTRTAPQIAQEIEFLGGSLNSDAGWDASEVTVRVMSDKLDKALAIVADTVINPTFAQAEINRYKTQTLDELSVNLKQPGNLAAYVANNVVFEKEAYGHLLGGTPESIARIKRLDLVNLHQKYYVPNNAVLVIAGDISPNSAFSIAQKHFGSWLNKPVPKMKSGLGRTSLLGGSDALKISKITVVDLPDAGQAAVTIAKFGFSRQDPEYFSGMVANSVLGGGYSARLNQEIRIKRGLSYGARSDLQARRYGGMFSTRTQTKNESAAEVAEIMVNELNRLATEPIAESELTPRKSVLTGNFSRDLETTNGLVNQIGALALYDLNLNEINSYIQNVQSVNDDSARRFVRTLYSMSNADIVIVGDAKKFLPDLQRRFPAAKLEIIPAAELDLNRADLRKAKAKS